jgi:hypothetical protein
VATPQAAPESAQANAVVPGTPLPRAQPFPTPKTLEYVKTFVGSTPVEVSFWQTQPFAARAYNMLEDRWLTFLVNMQESGKFATENGVVYVLGHKMLSQDAAALAIDPEADVIYVWLKEGEEAREYREGGRSITLPKAVRDAIAR